MEPQAKPTQVWNVRFDQDNNVFIPYRERSPFIRYRETEAEAATEAQRLNVRDGLVQSNPHIESENPHDFSHSGLGIGGINNDQSMPEIPSLATMERIERLESTDVICRRCGASKNFDGAMFTTGGGNICDDCF